MTDETKQLFMLAVQFSLEQVFEPEELAQDITLEANIGPVHRAFILVYDESAQPTQPCVPEPTLKLKEAGNIYFVYLLSEITARGDETTGEVIHQHPSESGQNRPVTASESWKLYEASQTHFRKLTRAKKLSDTFPNPIRGYAEVIGGSNRTFYPGDLYRAYREIAAYNVARGAVNGGKAAGAIKTRVAKATTLPRILGAIEDLHEEGKKITKQAIADRAGVTTKTIQRNWNKGEILELRNRLSGASE